jgi:hypothetical protein
MKIKGTTIQPVKPVFKTVFVKDKPREEQPDRAARFAQYLKGQMEDEKDG